MRIIYRMRGLSGDATEEFIETLDNKDSEDQERYSVRFTLVISHVLCSVLCSSFAQFKI